jgi:hypothetical protein
MPFERVVFCANYLFLPPHATDQLIGDVLTNRESGDKMFLSAITAPIYWRI